MKELMCYPTVPLSQSAHVFYSRFQQISSAIFLDQFLVTIFLDGLSGFKSCLPHDLEIRN